MKCLWPIKHNLIISNGYINQFMYIKPTLYCLTWDSKLIEFEIHVHNIYVDIASNKIQYIRRISTKFQSLVDHDRFSNVRYTLRLGLLKPCGTALIRMESRQWTRTATLGTAVIPTSSASRPRFAPISF